MKYTGEDGIEIDVFTTEEVAAREIAARDAVIGEYKPKLEEATTKLTAAEKAAAERAVEFGQFRKLSEQQVAQLSEKDAIIYNNTKVIAEVQEREAASKQTAKENTIATVIRSKVGNNEALFTKVKDMYAIVGLEDTTPEQMATRVNAALGAIGQTEPDLLAAAGVSFSGSFEPPKKAEGESTSYANTPEGKAAAAEFGLMTEPPKK